MEQREQSVWPMAGLGPSSLLHWETAYCSSESGGCLLVTARPRCTLHPIIEGRKEEGPWLFRFSLCVCCLLHHYGQIYCPSALTGPGWVKLDEQAKVGWERDSVRHWIQIHLWFFMIWRTFSHSLCISPRNRRWGWNAAREIRLPYSNAVVSLTATSSWLCNTSYL